MGWGCRCVLSGDIGVKPHSPAESSLFKIRYRSPIRQMGNRIPVISRFLYIRALVRGYCVKSFMVWSLRLVSERDWAAWYRCAWRCMCALRRSAWLGSCLNIYLLAMASRFGSVDGFLGRVALIVVMLYFTYATLVLMSQHVVWDSLFLSSPSLSFFFFSYWRASSSCHLLFSPQYYVLFLHINCVPNWTSKVCCQTSCNVASRIPRLASKFSPCQSAQIGKFIPVWV